MWQLALILVTSLCLRFGEGQEIVYLNFDTEVHGTIMTTRNGRNISAYRGIPYAKPPVGPLRFRSTQKLISENQAIIADSDGNQCPQFNDDGVLVGDEDCLYLNVYTPNTWPEYPYPTMVYFHGGDFVKGSGSSIDAGPEYLLDRDIVLVTVNYRLGVLGFLSTGDKQAPGNFGLKDQVVALKWVQSNILSFGGHLYDVTIFGQGAGGVSTSLHAISDASNEKYFGAMCVAVFTGLFEKYISQSGNIIAFWSTHIIDSYKKHATKLGNYLNCPTNSSRDLVNCLRNVDAYSLVDTNDIFDDKFGILSTWGPTVETKDSPDVFLNRDPVDILVLYGKKIKDIPAMFGNVADEGLVYTAEFQKNSTIFNRIKEDLYGFLNYISRIVFGEGGSSYTATTIEDLLFNDTDPSDIKSLSAKVTWLLTQLSFVMPLDYQIRELNKNTKTPIYLYSFDYRGTFSGTSLSTGNNENIGVTHGDELIYLFPMNPKLNNESSDRRLSKSDENMIDIMIDLWTSFAYTGIPTTNSTSGPYLWEAYNNETMCNLKIGNNSDPTLSTQYQLHRENLDFWYTILYYQLNAGFFEAAS